MYPWPGWQSNRQGYAGFTPLHMAVNFQHHALIPLLLAAGADVRAPAGPLAPAHKLPLSKHCCGEVGVSTAPACVNYILHSIRPHMLCLRVLRG